MIDKKNLYKEFCDALPKNLELSEDKKKQAFDFIFKLCYTFTMECWNDLFYNSYKDDDGWIN